VVRLAVHGAADVDAALRGDGDTRYLDFAVTNWWRTTDYLYDKDEHLFFRDSTFFTKTEANGKKVFWSRGNGWVMAGPSACCNTCR
jgi:unsaturated rhamnogalacturonyl hydrolase